VRLSFWLKASSEEYDGEVFDYAYLSLDGEPLGTLSDYQLQGIAIGGKTDWTNVVYDIMDAGEHTVRWTYKKDEVDGSDVGEDRAWLDEVTWTPNDPLPEIAEEGEIKAALARARAEVQLRARLTTVSDYTEFRSWMDKNRLDHQTVKDAPNAWLSYVLDAPG